MPCYGESDPRPLRQRKYTLSDGSCTWKIRRRSAGIYTQGRHHVLSPAQGHARGMNVHALYARDWIPAPTPFTIHIRTKTASIWAKHRSARLHYRTKSWYRELTSDAGLALTDIQVDPPGVNQRLQQHPLVERGQRCYREMPLAVCAPPIDERLDACGRWDLKDRLCCREDRRLLTQSRGWFAPARAR